MKPGAKVVFRPKGSDHSPLDVDLQGELDEDDKYIFNGHSWVSSGVLLYATVTVYNRTQSAIRLILAAEVTTQDSGD